MFYWLLKFVLLGPWLRLLFRPRVEGQEHLPADGAAIIASNHLSFSDSIFMPLMVPRRVTFLAKQEYFTGRGLKGWLSRMFFKPEPEPVPIAMKTCPYCREQVIAEATKCRYCGGELHGIEEEARR